MSVEQLINFEIFILEKKNSWIVKILLHNFLVIYDFLNQHFFENNTIIVKVAKVLGHVNWISKSPMWMIGL
jgi:hypothetical protein